MIRKALWLGFGSLGWYMAYGAFKRLTAVEETLRRALEADDLGINVEAMVLAYRVKRALHTGKCDAPSAKAAVAGQGSGGNPPTP